MALTFFASVPSGDSSVVSLRARLHDECFGPGFLQTHKPQTCRVLHVNNISSFITSDSIVVGFGEHINPTPWINPLDFGSFSFSTFEQYFSQRADKFALLAPLFGKTLLCNCTNKACHAEFLKQQVDALVASADIASAPGTVVLEDTDDPEVADELGDIDKLADQFRDFTTGNPLNFEDFVFANTLPPPLRAPGWPEAWVLLVATIRGFGVRVFWEICAGTARLSAEAQRQDWSIAPPIDIIFDASFDLLNVLFFGVILGIVLEGRIAWLHVSPPCASWTRILNSDPRSQVRSLVFLRGLPGLHGKKLRKVLVGNALLDTTTILCQAQNKAAGVYTFEHPDSALSWATATAPMAHHGRNPWLWLQIRTWF